MSGPEYKKKISKSLDSMDANALKQAWLILQEINNKKHIPDAIDKKNLESKLSRGVQQLNNREGTDFVPFIKGLKKKYGKK